MCYALPVSSVEDFRPLHKTDFDNQKVYLVHRTEENGSAGQPCEAQIFALAGRDQLESDTDSHNNVLGGWLAR
ncbi:BEN domain-containing protein 5 [Liparis tanakae]|uniref:BEN domain-containing protein 5 n=1 Tax=Liparis tanakae TaxID=230148 RepID=A0A4Z2ICZ4_9TELE|nr:BEN domain-containing protein 5 [Liparis tanakae]